MKMCAGWVLLIIAMSATAANYQVTVTRKAQDMYRVDGRDLFILTRWCYEYSYSENAILKWDGFNGSLVFLRAANGPVVTCEVEMVLTKATI